MDQLQKLTLAAEHAGNVERILHEVRTIMAYLVGHEEVVFDPAHDILVSTQTIELDRTTFTFDGNEFDIQHSFIGWDTEDFFAEVFLDRLAQKGIQNVSIKQKTEVAPEISGRIVYLKVNSQTIPVGIINNSELQMNYKLLFQPTRRHVYLNNVWSSISKKGMSILATELPSGMARSKSDVLNVMHRYFDILEELNGNGQMTLLDAVNDSMTLVKTINGSRAVTKDTINELVDQLLIIIGPHFEELSQKKFTQIYHDVLYTLAVAGQGPSGNAGENFIYNHLRYRDESSENPHSFQFDDAFFMRQKSLRTANQQYLQSWGPICSTLQELGIEYPVFIIDSEQYQSYSRQVSCPLANFNKETDIEMELSIFHLLARLIAEVIYTEIHQVD